VRLDGPINAVVVRDFDRARQAAKSIDQTRLENDPRPLLGVAMTVKEAHDVEGLVSTWGIPGFEHNIAERDSVAVARLKNAGAVILGKTNPSMALADWQCVNPVYGRTVNPHDASRSPGGSSGGSAAALAAGMVPLELGSDIGGSIRIPAHMCGVFGHKPTAGLVPQKGHSYPGTKDAGEIDLAVLGPMARCASDLKLALGVLAGGPTDSRLHRQRHANLKDFRVAVIDRHPIAQTDASVLNALNTLAFNLEAVGVSITRSSANIPDLDDTHTHYREMLMAILASSAPEADLDTEKWRNMRDNQQRVISLWQDLFDEVDIVIAPPFGVPAFPHDDNPDWGMRHLLINGKKTAYGKQVAWSGLATYPGLPSTAVPISTTEAGLPIGVQIIGGKFDDLTTILFAELLEEQGLVSLPNQDPRVLG